LRHCPTSPPTTCRGPHEELILAAALASLAGLALAQPAPASAAASGPKAKTAQQSKMGACNEQAGDKKGAERKAFMKSA
jgi:hypothetical protein